jgi:hypothetical protein
MNPTQDNNQNTTTVQGENHMISVKPVIKKTFKLKVFVYLLILIVITILSTFSVYFFQSPISVIKKSLINFDNTKLYQINLDMSYLDSADASSTTTMNLLTTVDSSSEKLLLSMKADMDIMNENIKIESKAIGTDLYVKIDKASFIEMFLGKDLLYKWIYISPKDVKNNPLGINMGSTTADNLNKITARDKGIELIDKGIVKVDNSKIQFEDGKIIRKIYFDIDKEKLAEYINTDINKSSPDIFDSMKESFDKTDVNEVYVVTDFFDNSFKYANLKFSFNSTSSVQTMDILLKYDDLDKIGVGQLIEAPKDFTSLESIFKDFMDRSVKQ